MADANLAPRAAAAAAAEPVQQNEESFFDKHFVKIALAVSAFVLLTITPYDFLFGTLAGLAFHYCKNQPVGPDEKVITFSNAYFSMIGAAAALLRFTPGGRLGGFIFMALPSLCSLSFGDTVYRAHQIYNSSSA